MIEPEIDRHTGDALECAALYSGTGSGLVSFLVFYPLVSQKFSEIFCSCFFIYLSALDTT